MVEVPSGQAESTPDLASRQAIGGARPLAGGSLTDQETIGTQAPAGWPSRLRRSLGVSGWNAAWVASSTVLVRAVGLVGTVLLARYLDPEGFGLYSTVLAYLALALAVGGLGLDRLLLREAAADGAQGQLFSTARLVCAGTMTLLAAAFFVLGGARGEVWVWGLAGLAALPAADAALVGALFQARERFDVPSAAAVVQVISMTSLVAVGVIVAAPMAFFIAAYAASEAVRWAYLVLRLRRLEVPWGGRAAGRLGEMLREAAPYAVLTVLGVIYIRIDIVMLEALVGGAEVGYYAGATRVLFLLNTLPMILLGVLFPRFARMQHTGNAEAQRLYVLVLRVVGWLGVVFPLVLVLVAVPALTFLYGPGYVGAAPSMRWLMVALFFMFLHAPNGTVLFSGRNLGVIVALSCVTAGFNVVANLYAIPRWGAAGAAATTAASEFLSFAVFTPVVCARLGLPGRALAAALVPRLSRADLSFLLGRR